jgi:hypothetical protein
LKGAWYYRPWTSSFEGLDAEASRVLSACGAGKAEPKDRRPIVPEVLRRPKVHVLDQTWGRRLVEWSLPRLGKGWRPEMLFLRKERRVRVDGVDWIVDVDGYWEPPDRKGLEIDLVIMSARPISHDVWKRLESTGFIDRLGTQLRKFGLRPSMRPRLGMEDFEGTSGDHYFTTFERKVPRVEDAASVVGPLLKWSPT